MFLATPSQHAISSSSSTRDPSLAQNARMALALAVILRIDLGAPLFDYIEFLKHRPSDSVDLGLSLYLITQLRNLVTFYSHNSTEGCLHFGDTGPSGALPTDFSNFSELRARHGIDIGTLL